MCFSETASFTASAILTLQGLAAIRLVRSYRPYLLIACIPLFFAIQQFSEGVIWRYFNQGHSIEGLGMIAAYIFLTFAYLVWPIAIPLSLSFSESNPFKKRILQLFVLGGFVWGIYLLTLIPGLTLSVTNSGKGILYAVNYFSTASSLLLQVVYLGLVIIPIFVSSLRYIWIFGLVTLISAFVARYFYETTFTSVWCFFGAILSLIIYKILKVNLVESKDYLRS